ncbi:MAG TPA: Gfo/Idh/MocA family oxidoreductase [Candidatus Margulisiibacteriota bacterium]|nr:Gfo/Idh/MocA family oxidoreductase [Candidatus Margulisiibacteriota bacterium]
MSVRSRLRVALLGCGRIAHVHCGYLRQLPQVEFVGACDSSRAAREAFTARWQSPTYADADELLAAAQPDVVHVLTPPATHAGLAIQLLDAGVHVLVEKPMALTVAEADAMLAAASRARKYLTVDHNRWFDPVVQEARALLASGALGPLVGVDVFQGAAVGEAELPPGQHTHWKASLPGGILYDLAPHPAYLLHGFVGTVGDLHVVTRRGDDGKLRELRAVVDGARALGSLTISLDSKPFMNHVTLCGTTLTAEANLNNMTLIVRRTRHVPKLIGKVLPNVDEAWQLLRATVRNGIDFVRGRQRYYPGMGLHFRALYEALAEGAPPPVSAEDGRAGVQLLERMWTQAGVVSEPPVRLVARA